MQVPVPVPYLTVHKRIRLGREDSMRVCTTTSSTATTANTAATTSTTTHLQQCLRVLLLLPICSQLLPFCSHVIPSWQKYPDITNHIQIHLINRHFILVRQPNSQSSIEGEGDRGVACSNPEFCLWYYPLRSWIQRWIKRSLWIENPEYTIALRWLYFRIFNHSCS